MVNVNGTNPTSGYKDTKDDAHWWHKAKMGAKRCTSYIGKYLHIPFIL